MSFRVNFHTSDVNWHFIPRLTKTKVSFDGYEAV